MVQRKAYHKKTKMLRIVIDPAEIDGAVTVELVLRGRGEQQAPSPTDNSDKPTPQPQLFPAHAEEAPALPLEPPAVPPIPPPGQEGLSQDQRRVIALLEREGRSLRMREIIAAAQVQGKYNTASKMIERLARLEYIAKDGRGRYMATPQQPTA